MEQAKLKQLIFKVLKSDERLWNEDKIELNQTLLLDLVENIDEKVIDLLLQEKDLREKFFVKIKDVYVFKTNDFRFFMEENKVDNSYTAYKNRIGLTDGKKFLKDTNDVVLDFPYKDCVLEGGQSTEEGTDTYFEYSEKAEQYEEKQGKRKEIFFNQVLAHDEIDRLFDAKALTNWKRFTKDGEQEVKEIKRDENGIIKENLIIKGNNLLALHSLKKQFAGKIKLIYIDPPYYFKDTKADDAFAYNSNFKLSTWLTFMKNRLDIAKKLLADEGTIFVQIKDDGMAHLKLLMDDVFGIDNFVNCIAVKMSEATGVKMSHAKTRFPNIKEYILFYKKSLNFKGFTKIELHFAEIRLFNFFRECKKNKIMLQNRCYYIFFHTLFY
jgi:adenine-specific DNA-methyltransferase